MINSKNVKVKTQQRQHCNKYVVRSQRQSYSSVSFFVIQICEVAAELEVVLFWQWQTEVCASCHPPNGRLIKKQERRAQKELHVLAVEQFIV